MNNEYYEKYKEPELKLRRILESSKSLPESAEALIALEEEDGLTGNRIWKEIVYSVLREYANKNGSVKQGISKI